MYPSFLPLLSHTPNGAMSRVRKTMEKERLQFKLKKKEEDRCHKLTQWKTCRLDERLVL